MLWSGLRKPWWWLGKINVRGCRVSDPSLMQDNGVLFLSQDHQTGEAVWMHSCQHHRCPTHLLLHHSPQGIICGVFCTFYLPFSLGLSFQCPRYWVFHFTLPLLASILTANNMLENIFLYKFFMVSYQIRVLNSVSEAELAATARKKNLSAHGSKSREVEGLYHPDKRVHSKHCCQNWGSQCL